MLKDHLVFWREFLLEFQSTGTFCPTSKWAVRALTNPLRESHNPVNILELGPGTGSVTVKILRDMKDGDRLTICEINPRFMKALKEKLNGNEDYQRRRDQVKFFEGAIQDFPETGETFDLIVCALPFLNFTLDTVKEIFAKLERMSTADTVMTYYEYIGLRSVGRVVSSSKHKRRIEELDSFFRSVYARHPTKRHKVWLNVLPVYIYTVRMAA